jgi:hypothetical protein
LINVHPAAIGGRKFNFRGSEKVVVSRYVNCNAEEIVKRRWRKRLRDGLDSNLPQSLPEEAGAADSINIEVFNARFGSDVLIGGPIIGRAEPHIFAETSGG